jgi:hypothetical protein
MEVSINGGSPKWVFFLRENPIEMDEGDIIWECKGEL